MMKSSRAKEETDVVEATEENEEEDVIELECKHCGNYPCWEIELGPVLTDLRDTYGSWKTNRQMRYLMYTESVTHIFGTALGKRNRKKLPVCVSRVIKEMYPDKEYTGFISSPQDTNNDRH